MDLNICDERHKRVDEKLGGYDKRLDNHDDRLDKVEQDGREFKIEIKNLCENIKSLVTIARWFMGLLIGAFVSFFFYAVQTGIFKK